MIQTDLAGNISEATEKIIRYATAAGGGGGKSTYLGCRDEKAKNYDPQATHKADMCEYQKTVELETQEESVVTAEGETDDSPENLPEILKE